MSRKKRNTRQIFDTIIASIDMAAEIAEGVGAIVETWEEEENDEDAHDSPRGGRITRRGNRRYLTEEQAQDLLKFLRRG